MESQRLSRSLCLDEGREDLQTATSTSLVPVEACRPLVANLVLTAALLPSTHHSFHHDARLVSRATSRSPRDNRCMSGSYLPHPPHDLYLAPPLLESLSAKTGRSFDPHSTSLPLERTISLRPDEGFRSRSGSSLASVAVAVRTDVGTPSSHTSSMRMTANRVLDCHLTSPPGLDLRCREGRAPPAGPRGCRSRAHLPSSLPAIRWLWS